VTDYKKYSLGQVENFLYDAMSTDATPQEIYDVIKSVVEDNYYTYKVQTEKAYELLALLNGNGKGHIQAYDEYLEKGENLQYTEEELNAMCTAAEEEELISKGYFKEDGFWRKSKNKVIKWSLPVELDPSGEYFVTFPDDLLGAANLKEGDQIEWIDQKDGSYLLKKVEKPMTHQEMLDAGYYMTDDGFWILKSDGC
jgi:hypothetical protein